MRLERDIVGRDDYGRLLAYVYRLDDDLFVNEALVRDGLRQPAVRSRPTAPTGTRFVAAAVAAEQAGLGLWGACGG